MRKLSLLSHTALPQVEQELAGRQSEVADLHRQLELAQQRTDELQTQIWIQTETGMETIFDAVFSPPCTASTRSDHALHSRDSECELKGIPARYSC